MTPQSNDPIVRDFGRVHGASGVNGFSGDGWEPHRRLPKFLRPDFTGMTDVYKTSTIDERAGNTPLKGKEQNYEPQELFPKSVYLTLWMWILGVVLNAWGLSGPGFKALLDTGWWQGKTRPFMLSVMPVSDTREKRREEVLRFKNELAPRLKEFKARFALQINVSCPNTEVHPQELTDEVWDWLDILKPLNISILVKWSVDLPLEPLLKLEPHPAFSGACISNSVKFGNLADRIRWRLIFPFSRESPLKRFGGGGLSGRSLLPPVEESIRWLRKMNFKKHINGGGGILSRRGAKRLFDAGADSIAIGSVAMLRPWRVQSIIRFANSYQPNDSPERLEVTVA